MTRPAVTVLMPVRNGARHLDEAVSSILRQSLGDLELLVCDDGSVDATAAMLTAHAGRDARVRVLTLPQRGIVAALNTGLAEARADWIARMDADDVAHPDRLRQQLEASLPHPRLAAIGSAWRVVSEDGAPRRIMNPPTEPGAIALALRRHNCLAHPTMLLRREAVLRAGGYRSAFRNAEDYDLWLRLSETWEIRALPQVLLDYREHPAQAAWSAIEQRLLSVLGAQLCAAARRDGRADPAPERMVIDHAWLRGRGMPPAAIAAALAEGALGAATDALRAGQGGAARAALRLLVAQPGLRLRTFAHAALLLLRSARGG